MRPFFKGYYYKHQKGTHTLCIIVGRCGKESFIQIITEKFSVEVPYTKGNVFSKKGVHLNICTPEISLRGNIRYHDLTPIQYDVMGPFGFLPMQCRHGVISMRHRLEGKVRLNGKFIDFTDGVGYVEMDSGRAFPSSYMWIQANDYEEPCSVMAAVANIPFCGFHFRGCICVIQYRGKEFRLATYLGVKVLLCNRNRLVLKQGKYILDIRVKVQNARKLSAPQKDGMTRRVMEAASCGAEISFYEKNRYVFHLSTRRASYEYENIF